MKKGLSFLLVILSFFILVACNNSEVGIVEGTVTINVGEEKEVELIGLTHDKVTYKSVNEAVVIISEDGKYKGLEPGLTSITVTYKKQEWILFVVVIGERININLEFKNIEIDVGDTRLINFTTNDTEGVSFNSLNEEILTVDSEGLISTLAAGATSVVIISKTNPNVTVTLDVKVLSLAEQEFIIEIIENEIVVGLNETKKLTVTTTDPNGVIFESLNEDVFTVDEEGLIKGLTAGSANLIVSSKNNPSVTKTINVVVVDSRSVEEILFTEAINNTNALRNYTLEFYVSEYLDGENYYSTFFLKFAEDLAMFKADHIEEYYETVDGISYIYTQTPEGFVKEESSSSNEGFIIYQNFTFADFNYIAVSDKYTLGFGKDYLLEDFSNLFGDDGIILQFELTIKDSYIEAMKFIFVVSGYTYTITISIKDIGTTNVEVPNHV